MAILTALAASCLLADFSYQETTTITGGSLMSMMKVVGVFSKQARQLREPIVSTVAIKGDRMVHRSPTHISIVDLGNETITSIDLEKKVYSVMTFDEMKQALENASKQLAAQKPAPASGGNAPSDVDMKFDASVNSTGKTKQIGGLEAKETVVTLTLKGTNKQTGQSGAFVTIADEWLAPKAPGYDEVRNFYRRMAQKINWTPNSNLFAGRSDLAQSTAEIYKESAKLDGIPVFTTVSIGPEGMQPVDRSEGPAPQSQSQGPSAKSVLGGALKGRFGLGGRKKEPEPEQQPAENTAGNGVLMEMTTQMSNFSSAPVDPSLFEVPAGFKKVEPEWKGMQK